MPPPEPGSLEGRRILIVEDEYFIAQDLVAMLETVGAHPVGPAPTLAQAERLCATEDRLDGAILDVNLGGEMVWPLVDILESRGVTVVLATGYGGVTIPKPYAGLPRCDKPTSLQDLVRHLAR